MLEVGIVESVNEKRGTAKVTFDRKSACDKCRMCLTASGEKMKVYVEVKNTLGAKVGDKVGVTMSDRFILKAAFIVYIIPVLLVGAGLAIFRKLGDLLLLAVVAACLLLGTVVGILADRLIRKRAAFSPTLSAIYDEPGSAGATEGTEANDRTEPTDSTESTERSDPTAPTGAEPGEGAESDPADKADPTDPPIEE